MRFKLIMAIVLVFAGAAAFSQQNSRLVPKADAEFRAAWVATVANINWPSKPGLSTAEQQKEAIALLDMLKRQNMNAVIFQARPQADALYKSELEPWSYFLTGKQGQAPDPYYDPLEFWINAAHERGLELHVWLNPYRAHHIAGKEITDQSIVRKNPELVYELKEGYWWLDPAKKGTQDHSAAVVRDIVKRYDIDGVHFDDYFYPYKEYNKGEDFPDNDSWAAYQQKGGRLSRADWRREAVNTLIKRVYKEIKAEKKHVKFGLSPFGIWQPGYPAPIEGGNQYANLYADAKLWINKGWMDYFAPQLYWQVNDIPHSFPVLLGWWALQNTKGRHLWPGMNSGIGGGEKNSDEIINQIMITRGIVPESPGGIHWSIGALTKHESLRNDLLKGPYKREALVPPSPWLSKKVPAVPAVTHETSGDEIAVTWRHPQPDEVFRYVVYLKYGNTWTYKLFSSHELSHRFARSIEAADKTKTPLSAIAVSSVGRTGNESSVLVKDIAP